MKQIIGRGTRLSEKFPVTVYIQLYSTLLDRNLNAYPLHEAFGYDKIVQGQIIGPGASSSYELIKRLPYYLHEAIVGINQKTVNEVFLKPEYKGDIPEDYISLRQILIDTPNLTRAYALRHLKAAGFIWHSQDIQTKHGRKIERYYEPAAAEYFKQNPVALTAPANTHIKLYGLEKRYDISYNLLRKIVAEHQIPTETFRCATSGQEGVYLAQPDAGWLDRIIETEIPRVMPGDTSISHLMEELGVSREVLLDICAEKGFRSKLRRREGRPSLLMVNRMEAHILRAAVNAYPLATEEDVTRGMLVDEFDLTNRSELCKFLTPAHEAVIVKKRVKVGNSMRILDTWSGKGLEQLRSQLGRRLHGYLPPDVFPYALLHSVINISKQNAPRYKHELEERFNCEKIRLPGSSKQRFVIPWTAIKYLENRFGLRKIGFYIDYSQLPKGPNDTDIRRRQYARYIQTRLLPAELLVDENGSFAHNFNSFR